MKWELLKLKGKLEVKWKWELVGGRGGGRGGVGERLTFFFSSRKRRLEASSRWLADALAGR